MAMASSFIQMLGNLERSTGEKDDDDGDGNDDVNVDGDGNDDVDVDDDDDDELECDMNVLTTAIHVLTPII